MMKHIRSIIKYRVGVFGNRHVLLVQKVLTKWEVLLLFLLMHNEDISKHSGAACLPNGGGASPINRKRRVFDVGNYLLRNMHCYFVPGVAALLFSLVLVLE